MTEEANDRVEEDLVEASEVAADQPELDAVLDADNARVAARGNRLSEARPSVPTLVTVLLIISVAIIVGGSAALTNGRVRLPYSVPLIAATVVAFAGSLVVIIDLDQKFGGFARIEPVELRDVEQRPADRHRVCRRPATSGASHFPDDGESVATAAPHPSAASLRCAQR